jgi:hypothetical protein
MMTAATAQRMIWRVLVWIGGRAYRRRRRRRRDGEGTWGSGKVIVGRRRVGIGNHIGVLTTGRGTGVGKGTVTDIDGTTGTKSKI